MMTATILNGILRVTIYAKVKTQISLLIQAILSQHSCFASVIHSIYT